MPARSLLRLLLGLILLLAPPGGRAAADTPLPPPAPKEVWAPAKGWVAAMDPRTNLTVVHKVGEGARTRAWAMLGWYRVAFLADDGEHLVVGHPGINLLPLDVKEDDALLHFVRRGEVVRSVTLGEIVPRAALKRTASHLLWGSYGGLDAEGRCVVETVEGKRLRFDVATGTRVP